MPHYFSRRPFALWSSILSLVLLCVLVVASNAPLFAHTLQIRPVVVEVKPQDTFFTLILDGNGEDAVQAINAGTEARQENMASPEADKRFEQYVNDHLVLKQNAQVLRGKMVSFEYSIPNETDITTSRFEAIFRYQRPTVASTTKNTSKFFISSTLFNDLPDAATILSLGGVQKTLTSGQSVDYDPSQSAYNLWNSIKDFTILGAKHIFTGPDHMLFIVALLLTATSFWSLAKVLTGFTIAHLITLALSALDIISLNGRLTDIFIAASIIYVGLENIYLPKLARHRFWIAGAFGLVHGFGFSYILRDIGLPEEGRAWCLLSFNLGVEIAQIVIYALAFPLIMMLRKRMEENARLGGAWDWTRTMKFGSWLVARRCCGRVLACGTLVFRVSIANKVFVATRMPHRQHP